MQTLHQSLQDHDRGQLLIIAELWGIELPAGQTPQVAAQLAEKMLSGDAAKEQAASLAPSARDALARILSRGGSMPMAEVIRRYGPLREMGPGRRDRDKPWRNPTSPVEALWYRGLIARAFADTAKGPQEFAFVPKDLRARLPHLQLNEAKPYGAATEPPSRFHSAGTAAVDDATTLLAALRLRPARSPALPAERTQAIAAFFLQPNAIALLVALLVEEGILQRSPCGPDPEATRRFLDSGRGQVQARLLQAWKQASDWNDLAQVAHLRSPNGAWPNDPLVSREAALSLLHGIPQGEWWSLEAFLEEIKQDAPDFLRPASEFDSWYLQDAGNGRFLGGFEAWYAIEGELLRYLLRGPLCWLGAVEVGAHDRGQAFRVTPWLAFLIEGGAPPEIRDLRRRVSIRADGQIRVPREIAPALRYQVSRFSAWLTLERRKTYTFRLTPASLEAAKAQGLQATHVLAVLQESSGDRIPPKIVEALTRWAAQGTEAMLERTVILRVRNLQVLAELQSNRATARHLEKAIGTNAVRIGEAEWEALCAAALRAGLLIANPEAPGGISP